MKPRVADTVQKFPAMLEAEFSLPFSQEPITGEEFDSL
jgi:hypothetical protein